MVVCGPDQITLYLAVLGTTASPVAYAYGWQNA